MEEEGKVWDEKERMMEGSWGPRSGEDTHFSGSWEIKEEEVLPQGKKRPPYRWRLRATQNDMEKKKKQIMVEKMDATPVNSSSHLS